MNAYLGMRVTEWEDGQVNIGIAVCPTKRKSAPVIGCYWTRDTLLSNSDNDGDYILPKSAFIMRPATSHRHKSRDASRDTGFNITYAHQPQNGTSDLGIMLASTSSTQDQEQEQGEELSRSCFVSSSTDGEGDNMKVSEPEVSDALVDSASSELELQEVKRSLEKEDGSLGEKEVREDISGEQGSNLGVPQPTQIIVSKVNSDESGDSNTEKESTEEKVSLRKQAGGTHHSGMKRVSWLEDIEKFSEREEEKASRNNSKENKRESVRKSNGGGGGGGGKSSNRSPTKKQQQHGFNSDDANYREGYKAGKRNSGDKSRIPVIAGGGGGDYHPTSCEFYRRQMLRECCMHEDNSPPPTLADNWYGYTSLQKYAGQKVVKKFAAEQKRLEEDMSNRRKTEIWILGSDLDDFVITSPNVPIRKKTTRLRPIQMQS